MLSATLSKAEPSFPLHLFAAHVEEAQLDSDSKSYDGECEKALSGCAESLMRSNKSTGPFFGSHADYLSLTHKSSRTSLSASWVTRGPFSARPGPGRHLCPTHSFTTESLRPHCLSRSLSSSFPGLPSLPEPCSQHVSESPPLCLCQRPASWSQPAACMKTRGCTSRCELRHVVRIKP